jgi:hypothetical protein
MSEVGVGLYLVSSPIAWLASVRTRYSARNSPLTVALFNWMERWSVSSFWTNVELVAHSSTRRPPNSQLLSPSAVAVRRRASAPLRTATAPAAD